MNEGWGYTFGHLSYDAKPVGERTMRGRRSPCTVGDQPRARPLVGQEVEEVVDADVAVTVAAIPGAGEEEVVEADDLYDVFAVVDNLQQYRSTGRGR